MQAGVASRVDLHCHSSASFDGSIDPVALLELARERGLTHLAITDHDTIDGALAARAAAVPGIQLIVGEEVRTSEGDLIVLFVERRIPSGLQPEETVRLAREQGALVGLAHPFDATRPSIGRGSSRPEQLERLARLADYVEVHNGRVREQIANGRAADFAREFHVPQVAASDAHTEPEVGLAATVFDSDIATAADLRAALQAGGALRVREPDQAAGATGEQSRGLRGLVARLTGPRGEQRD